MQPRGFWSVTPVFLARELATSTCWASARATRRRYHAPITVRGPSVVAAGPAADQPLTTLRGAPAGGGNPRRVARVAVMVVLVAILVTAGALVVVGARKNAQVSELRRDGVRVEVTVTGCLGLLGGSGSNAAGYACRGVYRFDDRRYEEAIPGSELRGPGSTLTGIVARDDPALFTTPAVLRAEHPSWRVFLAPAVLALADLLLVGLLLARFRRTRPRRAGGDAQAGGV